MTGSIKTNIISLCALLTLLVCVETSAAPPPQNRYKGSQEALKLMNTPPDAYQLMREHDWQGAKKLIDKLVVQRPEDEDAWAAKAEIENHLSHTKECLKAAETGLSLKKRQGFFISFRGLSRLDLNDFGGAIKDFTQGASMSPENSAWYGYRSQAYERVGKPQLAEIDKVKYKFLDQLFSSWNKVLPANYRSMIPSQSKSDFAQDYAAGQRAFMRSDYPAAITYFSRVIKFDPDCKAAYLYRATAYQGTDDWKLAVDDYTKIINSGAKDFPLRAAPLKVSSMKFDQWVTVPFRVSQVYKQRARCLYGIQKYDQAVKDCTFVLKETPDDRYIMEMRGNVLAAMTKYPQAIADYEKAQLLTPEYPKLQDKMARCYRAIGDHKTAIKKLSWLIRMCPKDEVNWRARADSLSRLGFHKEAIADLTCVLGLDPESTKVYLERAKEFEALNNLKSALADYEKSISLDDSADNPAIQAREKALSKMVQARTTQDPRPK